MARLLIVSKENYRTPILKTIRVAIVMLTPEIRDLHLAKIVEIIKVKAQSTILFDLVFKRWLLLRINPF